MRTFLGYIPFFKSFYYFKVLIVKFQKKTATIVTLARRGEVHTIALF